jgi:hypothetical protein
MAPPKMGHMAKSLETSKIKQQPQPHTLNLTWENVFLKPSDGIVKP